MKGPLFKSKLKRRNGKFQKQVELSIDNSNEMLLNKLLSIKSRKNSLHPINMLKDARIPKSLNKNKRVKDLIDKEIENRVRFIQRLLRRL